MVLINALKSTDQKRVPLSIKIDIKSIDTCHLDTRAWKEWHETQCALLVTYIPMLSLLYRDNLSCRLGTRTKGLVLCLYSTVVLTQPPL